MNGLSLLAVGIAGFFGAIARASLSRLIVIKHVSAFPWNTFTINLLGCFLIGFFMSLPVRWTWLTTEMRMALTVGFCGSFTTFSTFSSEGLSLLRNGEGRLFIIYALLSIVAGMFLVYAGMRCAAHFFK